MATKLKKCKAFVGFTAFFLGIFLLLNAVPIAWDLFSYESDIKQVFYDAFEEDFQKTSSFRFNMSERLSYYIFKAIGENEEDIDLEGIESWSSKEWDTPERIRIRDELIAESGSGVILNYNNIQGYNLLINERDKRAEQQDKNILFAAFKNGVLKETNGSQVKWDKMQTVLPEEYNFLLYFDGEKTYAVKDGQPVDIYGDGYYTNNNDWDVPGYFNVSFNESAKQTEVYLAVRKEPINYFYNDRGQDFSVTVSRSLYCIAQNMRRRENFYYVGAFLASGIVFMFMYLLLRKDKAAADRWLARKTSKIYIEWKVLLCLAFGAAMAVARIRRGYWDFWVFLAYFLLSWPFYLLMNDMRYSKGFWRNSFFSKIYAKNIPYSFSRKYPRMFIIPALLVMLMLTASVCLMLSTLGDDDILTVIFPYAVCLLLLLTFLMLGAKHAKKSAVQLTAVLDQIHSIRHGETVQPLEFEPDAELRDAMDDLNHIQQGFENALEEKIQSERMKVELITNVSHDIKTPLTSIVSYIDLLRQEELSPEVKDYIQILEQKTLKLKEMVQDVFDISKAATHQLTLKEEVLDFGKLIRQTLADMEDEISKSPCSIRTEFPSTPTPVQADGQRMYRVFQNLIQNALRYSLEGSRIYVSLKQEDGHFTASVKNTSKTELPDGVDFTERFVRGDKSRTDGGSGLGLSIAKSFTEACGGGFRIFTNADLFTVEVEFSKSDKTDNI